MFSLQIFEQIRRQPSWADRQFNPHCATSKNADETRRDGLVASHHSSRLWRELDLMNDKTHCTGVSR